MGNAKQNAGSNISNLILPKSTDVMGTKKLKENTQHAQHTYTNEMRRSRNKKIKRIITTMQASQR